MGARATCLLLGAAFLIIFSVVRFVLAGLLGVFSLLFILDSGRGMVIVWVWELSIRVLRLVDLVDYREGGDVLGG